MTDTSNPRATYDPNITADRLFKEGSDSGDSVRLVAAGLFALAGSIESVAGAIKTAGGQVSRETAFVAEMIEKMDLGEVSNAIRSVAEAMGDLTTTEEG